MPPRSRTNPPKEPIIYPASKRKAPAFKPQRPGKAARVESGGTGVEGGFRKVSEVIAGRSSGGDARDGEERRESLGKEISSDEDDLDEDPLAELKKLGKRRGDAVPVVQREAGKKRAVAPTGTRSSTEAVPVKAKRPPVGPSSPVLDIFSSSPPISPNPPRASTAAPPLSQSDEIPTISQPLLLRLLHEGFADKATKIDKHAIQVLQKYMEVFVREAVARAALSKREAAERGEADEADKAWLELEDLDKIAPGMLLDF